MTHDGPVGNEGEKQGTEEQEGNINEGIGEDKWECAIKAVLLFSIEYRSLLQD